MKLFFIIIIFVRDEHAWTIIHVLRIKIFYLLIIIILVVLVINK
jgi:hypothetical protein